LLNDRILRLIMIIFRARRRKRYEEKNWGEYLREDWGEFGIKTGDLQVIPVWGLVGIFV
jgi:hypothetical protein